MRRFLIALLFSMSVFPAFAAEPSFKCLLVGIEKYELAPLDYAENDIGTLQQILTTRYDCIAQACIDTPALFGDTGPDAPKRSVMRKIENWCDSLADGDYALLYLAGHGVKDDSGKLYLAMINFDRKNFDSAAIPLSWIREQFGDCRGKGKVLLIDTCFAGSSKNIDFANTNSEEVNGSFAEMKNVAIIAGSRAGEKSWLWGDSQHSLFTYWLIEALKGHADLDSDRTVTVDELAEYLQDNVSWVARTALNREQNPVVLNAGAARDFRLPLRAVDLNRLIDDIAEQIDLQMRLERYSRLGVPEFTSGHTGTFESQFGSLSRWVAEALRKSLARKSKKNRSGYEVLADNALQEMLRSKGITPDDLGTEKTKNLRIGGDDIPLLVSGRLSMVGDLGLSLSVDLLDTNGKTEVGHAGGTAVLTQANLGQAGLSADMSGKFAVSAPDARASRDEPLIGAVTEARRQEITRLREGATRPHPMADPNNPFAISFETRSGNNARQAYRRRALTFEGNNAYLPISKGEEYRIRVHNKSGRPVFMAILVDGLNSLSQRISTRTRGAFVEAIDLEESAYQIAPRVGLQEARKWFFEPDKNAVIPGFVDANGEADALYRFRIVDADESVAARNNYTEQLGLITIGIFEAVSKENHTRQITPNEGTGMRDAERIDVETYKGGLVTGDMTAVYNIRYMTPETLRRLQK